MADVAMVELAEPELINFEKYEDGGGKGFVAPEPGRYTARAPIFPMSDDPEVFTQTKASPPSLKINVSPITIVGGSADGVEVRYSSLSAKKYSNREGNQIIDFIRACGLDLRPKTNEEYKAAVRQCSGRTFQFGLDLEIKNKNTQERIKSKDFPTGEDGKRQNFIQDEYDEKVRYWAYPIVRYYVSGLSKD